MQEAVEQGAPRDFMAYVSADFIGNQGEVDRNGLANVLRIGVRQQGAANCVAGSDRRHAAGRSRDGARDGEPASGRSNGAIGPERASVFSITSSWRREGSAWRCYNAKWEQEL